MRCISFNARSLKNKLQELHYLLYSDRYDLIFVCETWLYDDVPDGLLDPECKFNIMRCNRKCRRGGGVCVFMCKGLNYSIVESTAFGDSVEAVAVDIISDSGCTEGRYVTVYRRPMYLAEDVQHTQELIDWLRRICVVSWPIILLGDWNCPSIDWVALDAPTDGIQNAILDFVCDLGFEQLVSEPTHCNNIIDVLLTNNRYRVLRVDVLPPFDNSDHNCVGFTFDRLATDRQFVAPSHNSYDWKKANYNAFGNYLSQIDWDNFMCVNLTSDAIWLSFKVVLEKGIEQFVPLRPSASRSRVKNYPAHIRKAFASKKRLWRLCKQYPLNVELRGRYRVAAVKCRRLLLDHALHMEKKSLSRVISDSFINM